MGSTQVKASSTLQSTATCLLPNPAQHIKVTSGGKLQLPSSLGGKFQIPSASGGKLQIPSASGGKLQLPSISGGKLQLPCYASQIEPDADSSSSTQLTASTPCQRKVTSSLPTSTSMKVSSVGKLQLSSESSASHSGTDDPSLPKTGSRLPLPLSKSRQSLPSLLGLGAKKVEGS